MDIMDQMDAPQRNDDNETPLLSWDKIESVNFEEKRNQGRPRLVSPSTDEDADADDIEQVTSAAAFPFSPIASRPPRSPHGGKKQSGFPPRSMTGKGLSQTYVVPQYLDGSGEVAQSYEDQGLLPPSLGAIEWAKAEAKRPMGLDHKNETEVKLPSTLVRKHKKWYKEVKEPTFGFLSDPVSLLVLHAVGSEFNVKNRLTISDLEPDIKRRLMDGAVEQRGATFWQSVFNVVKSTVGGGIISIPFAFKMGGISGIIWTFLLTTGIYFSGWALSECQKVEGGTDLASYVDIAATAFGKWGKTLTTLMLLPELFLLCALFLVIAGSSFHTLVPSVNAAYWMLISVAIILPTIFIKEFSRLAILSLVGTISAIVLFLTVSGILIYLSVSNDLPAGPFPFVRWDGVPVAIGILLFCLGGTAVFPSLRSSMKDPSEFNSVLRVSFSFIGAFYVGLGMVSYFAFGNATSDNVIENLGGRFSHWASGAAIILMIVNILSSYSLILQPVAQRVDELIEPRFTGKLSSSINRLFLLALSWAVAYLVPNFGIFASLFGAVIGSLAEFVVPSIFYLKIFSGRVSKLRLFLVFLLLISGTAGGVLATYIDISRLL